MFDLIEHIVNLRDTNILVSASAGAGKTTLLIKRVLSRILKDRVSVAHICALTFSEAAAQEMKDRLKIELHKAFHNTTDDELKSFIYEQLTLIDTAMISTIHSFALSLIRDYAFVLNLDPQLSNNVLDDTAQYSLFSECCNIVVENAMKHTHDEFKALQQLVSTSDFDFSTVKELLLSIYKIRRLQLDPHQFDNKCIALHIDPLPVISPIICEEMLHKCDEISELLTEVQRLAAVNAVDMSSVCDMLHHVEELKEVLMKYELKQAFDLIHSQWIKYIPTIRNHDTYKAVRDKVRDKLKTLVSTYNDIDTHMSDIKSILPHIQFVIHCVQELSELIKTRKTTMKVIEFDDMEHFAYEILSHPNYNVRDFFKTQYSDILIDEFQDTNDLQNEIINLISRGNNIFRVGDVKQSIYRFRGAKPQLMRSIMNEQSSAIFVLPHNFRSKEPIVEFNNVLFHYLMNVHGFSDVYRDVDKVSPGKPQQKHNVKPVTYVMVNKTINDDDLSMFDVNDMDEVEGTQNEGEAFSNKAFETSATHAKARFITKDIVRKHIEEQIAFKDICVLVKTHAQKDVLKRYFDEFNIPHFINSPQGFLKHPAIAQILLLANYCLFPNEYHLVGVLLSDFTPLTGNEVAQLRSESSIITTFIANYPKLASELNLLQRQVTTSNLADAFFYLSQFNHFYHQCDSQGKLNIDALIQKAVNFEESHQGGLFAFIDSLEKLENAKIAEAMDVALGDNVVKVITIHKSKGLQFPIVYVFNDESTTLHAHKEQVVVDPYYGFTLRIKKPFNIEVKNLIWQALIYVDKKATYEESLRLWYVALTRAENEMICVGLKINNNPITSPLNASHILNSKGFNDLLSKLDKSIPPHLLQTVEVDDPNLSLAIKKGEKPVEGYVILPTIETKQLQPIVLSPLNLTTKLQRKAVGSLIHTILSQCINSTDPIEVIERYQHHLSDKDKQGMIAFFKHKYFHDWDKFEKYSEYPLITQTKTGTQQFYLDLLLKSDDVWIIVDFKSDQVNTLHELVTRYREQLLDYDTAVRPFAPTLKSVIFSIHLQEIIEIN